MDHYPTSADYPVMDHYEEHSPKRFKPEDSVGSSSVPGSEHKDRHRRSSRACQACRSTKTKCEPSDDDSPCKRCVTTGTPCYYIASKRGRTKGSKNRVTLEKLLNRSRADSSAQHHSLPDPSQSMDDSASLASQHRPSIHASTSYHQPQPHNPQMTSTYHGDENLHNQYPSTLAPPAPPNVDHPGQDGPSGLITPLDPHNLMLAVEEEQSAHPRKLTRKLLHILGRQFPIDEDGEELRGAEKREFEDPLPSIASIARRGWDLRENGKKRIRQPLALYSEHLSPDDAALLQQWSPNALQEIIREQTRYFEHGLHMSKRDVARGLDPIQQGVLSEKRAKELFDAYFDYVHPQWPVLSPKLHTLSFVQSRSALLATTILAIGATALASLPSTTSALVNEAQLLHAHVEKLSLVVYTTGARSVEIIQAHVLLSRYGSSPRTHLGEQRWIRSAMLPRLALEIGLDQQRNYDNNRSSAEMASQLRMNDIRTKAFMLINERRFFAWYGRQTVDLSHFELHDAEIEEITRLGAYDEGSAVPALYHLYLFECDVHQRLGPARSGLRASLALDAELDWVKTFTERWIQTWCPDDRDSQYTWHLIQEALSVQLQIIVGIAKKATDQASVAKYQQELLRLSMRMFKEAMVSPTTTHMTHRASVFAFAAAIILKFSDRRDIVLSLALRMAGEPGKAYIPTSRRSAGNQMLAMLCANHFTGGPTQHDEEDQNVPSAQAHNHHEPSVQAQPHPSEMFGTFDWNVLESLPGITQPTADSSNLFGFDGAFDFPYTPNAAFPQPLPQSLLPLSGDFEALLNGNLWMENGMSQGDHTVPYTEHLPIPSGSGLQHQPNMFQHPRPPHAHPGLSNLPPQGVSPMNTDSSAPSELMGDRTAHRQALYATIERLLQLAAK